MADLAKDTSKQKNVDMSSIDLGQSSYNFNYLVFPNDLGMENNPHYMIININEPTKTFDADRPASKYTNQFGIISGPGGYSKVDKLRFGSASTDGIPVVIGGAGAGVNRPAISLPRRTRRIVESIALHMPNPMVYNTQNAYEEISLTALAGKIGVGAFKSVAGLARGALNSVTGAAQQGGSGGNIFSPNGAVSTTSKLLQSPINPAVEILFATTMVRQFTFEVLMAPRNEIESEAMFRIIRRLRFHAAPEINGSTLGDLARDIVPAGVANFIPDVGAGLFWIPPAEFDLTFYHMGEENTNILRINTCVLERIEVDYAPAGTYSTFRNGHPVAARLSMGFRELEPVHRLRVLQGF